MATKRLSTYSFRDISFVWGGIIADGYQPGEGITIEKTADAYSLEVGIDGKATRSQILDRSATITVNLSQTSATNDLFSAIYNLGVNGVDVNGVAVGATADIAPMLIRDRNGRSRYFAAECWISKAPDVTYDQPSTMRAWVFQVAFLEEFTGGQS